MQITAGSTLLGRGGQHVLTFCLAIHRHDDLVDAIARAFVVDNGSGAEFGNGQEPGPRQEFIAPVLLAPARNIGGERQPWEVIAWQEALTGEVPVAVKVRLDGVLRLGKKFYLSFSLSA